MDNAEQLDFVSTTDAGEPDYQARHMGRAKYAIVLFGERDEVVGWDTMKRARSRCSSAQRLGLEFSESPCAGALQHDCHCLGCPAIFRGSQR